MEEERKLLSRRLKCYCKPSIVSLCDSVGLTEMEKAILLMYYCDHKPNDFIAHEMNMSRSSYYSKKRIALGKILDYKRIISRL